MLNSSSINEFAVLAVFDGKTVTVFPKTEEKSKWNVQWITKPQTKFWYFDKDHYYEYREGILVGIAHNEEFYWKIASESIKWLASAFCQFPDPRVKYLHVLQDFIKKVDMRRISSTNFLCSKIGEKMEQWKEIFKEEIRYFKSSDALVKKYYPVLVRPINLDPNWPKTQMTLDIHLLTSSLKDQSNLKEFSMEDGVAKQNPIALLPAFVVVVLFNEKSLTASTCEKMELYLKKKIWINETKFWFLDKDLIYTEGIVVAKNDNECMLDVRICLEQSKWIVPENNFDTFPDENVHQKEHNKVFYRRRTATYELALSYEENFHHWMKLLDCEDRYKNLFMDRRNFESKNCEVNTQDENLGVLQLLTRFATIVLTFDGNILNVQSHKCSDWDPKKIKSITNTKFWYEDEGLYYHEGIVIATCCNEDVLDVRKAFRKSEWIRPDDDFYPFPDPASSVSTSGYCVLFANKIHREIIKKSAAMQESDSNTEHRKENNRSELSEEAPIEHREIKRPTTVEASVVSSKLLEKAQVETANAKEDLEPTITSASNLNNYAITEKGTYMTTVNFEGTDSESEFTTIVFLFNGKFFSVHSYAETELYSEDIHWITDTKFWFLDRQKNLYSEGIVVKKCDKDMVPDIRTALEESAMSIVERDFHPFPDLNQKAANVVEEFNRRRISIQNEMSEESPERARIIRNLLLNYKDWLLIWGKRHGLDTNCPEPLHTTDNPTEQLEVSKKKQKKLNERSEECDKHSHENDQNKRVTRATIRAQNRRSSPPEASKAAHVDLPKVSKYLPRGNSSTIGRRDLKSHKLKYSTRKKIKKEQDKIASKKLTKHQFLQILGLIKNKRK